MLPGQWFKPPRQLLAVFLLVALASAAALGWLGWLLLTQDAALEAQRRQDSLEQSADRALAAMQRSIADVQAATASATRALPDGVGAVVIDGREIESHPKGLIYYPVRQVPPASAAVIRALSDAERFEFGNSDLTRAEAAYRALTSARSEELRAAALARLARVRRKLKEPIGAIRAYDALSSIDKVHVDGIPAGLVARVGRASVFEETARLSELQVEAAALRDELSSGMWRLVESEYDFYSSQAADWGVPRQPDNDERIRADAAAWLWQNRSVLPVNERRALSLATGAALVAWQRKDDHVTAIVAGPIYVARLCADAVPSNLRCTLTDSEGRLVIGARPPTRATSTRSAAASGLPWTLHVYAANGVTRGGSPRRPLLLSVFAVVALVLAAGWYFILRAMSREQRVSRLQSDFVAAVSHEFRSPLTSLSHIAEMLAGDRLSRDRDRRRSYAVLVRETDRLRRLVEDLLEFGRFEAGAAGLRFEPLDVAALVRDTVSDFQQRIVGDGYAVELSGADAAIQAHADREALSRALWNLLDNAVKYSPECRTVWVDLVPLADVVSIAVRDNGLGIPAHEQREIFERFVRGADSKARRIKGTGIGLAIVREIVRAHGGEIQLASEPGRGSRFTMILRTAGAAA